MSTPDDKLVARVLRENAHEYDAAYASGSAPTAYSIQLHKRADELDPPPPVKSRADRIVEKYNKNFDGCEWWETRLRRILKEEGIE